MLRFVALKSCDRLAGDLRESKFKYEHDLTPVLSTAVSLRVDLDCEEGVLVPRKVSDRKWRAGNCFEPQQRKMGGREN